MAKITKTVTRKSFETIGFECDVCGKECLKEQVEGGIDINYSFGYGTIHDMITLETQICDSCFYDLIKNNVPGAIFREF